MCSSATVPGAALVGVGGKLPLPPRRAGLPGQLRGALRPRRQHCRAPPHVHMDGQSVFRFAVEAVPPLCPGGAGPGRLTPEDIDLFVFHQANQRIIDFCREKLGIDPARCPGNIERTANTSAASVPLLLDDGGRAGPSPPARKPCVWASRRADLGRLCWSWRSFQQAAEPLVERDAAPHASFCPASPDNTHTFGLRSVFVPRTYRDRKRISFYFPPAAGNLCEAFSRRRFIRSFYEIKPLLGIEFPSSRAHGQTSPPERSPPPCPTRVPWAWIASGGMDAEACGPRSAPAKANTGKPFGVNLNA